MKNRVKALGGVFFKSNDPAKLKEWYKNHLGIASEEWGTQFDWRYADQPDKTGMTVWSVMREESTYFAPSEQKFILNYIVDNLDELLATLKTEGITIFEKSEESEFGKFGWILDPEGRKIELWQPLQS